MERCEPIEKRVEVLERMLEVEIDGQRHKQRQIHTWVGKHAAWWQKFRVKRAVAKL